MFAAEHSTRPTRRNDEECLFKLSHPRSLRVNYARLTLRGSVRADTENIFLLRTFYILSCPPRP